MHSSQNLQLVPTIEPNRAVFSIFENKFQKFTKSHTNFVDEPNFISQCKKKNYILGVRRVS